MVRHISYDSLKEKKEQVESNTTPHFIQCIVIIVVLLIITLVIVTVHVHYTGALNTEEYISHLSHMENVHDMINTLEIPHSKIESKSETIISEHTNQNINKDELKYGDIEATRKIFEQLTVVNDVLNINICTLPQSYTIFENIVNINVSSFKHESNVNHEILTKAIKRYKSLMFPHKTNRIYNEKENSNTIHKLIIYVLDNGEDDTLNIGFDEGTFGTNYNTKNINSISGKKDFEIIKHSEINSINSIYDTVIIHPFINCLQIAYCNDYIHYALIKVSHIWLLLLQSKAFQFIFNSNVINMYTLTLKVFSWHQTRLEQFIEN